MKNIDEMTDRELQEQILKYQRSSARKGSILAFAGVLLVLLAVLAGYILIPKAVNTLRGVDILVEDTSRVVLEAESSLEDINEMVRNINEVVELNNEDLTTSIQKISEIDIEALNDSIKKFGDAIEPIAQFAKIFSR